MKGGKHMSSTITDFLRDLEQSRFYGSVELKYENGQITIARKSQSIKFDAPYRNNRGNSNVDKQG
jgi:hypothetical protein